MALLFKKIENLERENRIMKEQLANQSTVQYIKMQNVANHFNTVFNFTLVGFNSEYKNIKPLLAEEVEKLAADVVPDVSHIKQIQNHIVNMVMKIHRNPNRKELQNIYVTDPEERKDNAFIYDDGWKITDWSKLNRIVLNSLYNNLVNTKLNKKEDKLEVMKHIFIQGGCGDRDTVMKMTDDDVAALYMEIGLKLNFKTITL
jgi:hypothetical protein